MIEGTVHGRRPSPRALLWGWDSQPETLEQLKKLFPTWAVIRSPADVRQAEHDVLVACGQGITSISDHLYVLSFDGNDFGVPWHAANPAAHRNEYERVRYVAETIAREFVVPNQLPDNLDQLARTQLLPLVESLSDKPYFEFTVGSRVVSGGLEEIRLRPFLATTEPRVLAGSFTRRGGKSECWAFVTPVSDPVPWVAAALEEWQQQNPERFPAAPQWEHGPSWRTAAEDKAAETVDKAKQERVAVVKAANDVVGEAEAALAAARLQADTGFRRLLTAQGPDLVAATIQALESLGFKVQDMDSVWPDRDKREDLRIQDPTRGDWEVLAEVRGYARGAQLKDLMRISARFVPRYRDDLGRPPHGAWYIVNHFVAQDPTSRQRVLASNDAEVDIFAEGDPPGAVIDTIRLFELCRAVERGTITPDDARVALVEARGIFELPSEAH